MVDESRIAQLVAPAVESFGASLYDVEFSSGTLRIFVEHSDGINSDMIGDITKSISHLLDFEDVIPGRYLLEVSSPGIERKLRTEAHFRAQINNVIYVKLRVPSDGIRRMEGTLLSCDNTGVVLEREGSSYTISFDEIETARATFDWEAALKANSNDVDGELPNEELSEDELSEEEFSEDETPENETSGKEKTDNKKSINQ